MKRACLRARPFVFRGTLARVWIEAGMKKATGSKKKATKAAKRAKGTKKAKPASKRAAKPKDLAAVRERISNIVTDAATNITKKLAAKAADGELAHSKYLFEVAGVYPASESAKKPPEEESLAKTLLQRMGLPTTPMVDDETGEALSIPLPLKEAKPAASEEKAAETE